MSSQDVINILYTTIDEIRKKAIFSFCFSNISKWGIISRPLVADQQVMSEIRTREDVELGW